MTNAEKFLKDGVSAENFVNNFVKYRICHKGIFSASTIFEFLREQSKPQLTEDERVILRNIDKQFIKIGRDKTNGIYFVFATFSTTEARYWANVFDDVFQFIKERRRIRNRGAVRKWVM